MSTIKVKLCGFLARVKLVGGFFHQKYLWYFDSDIYPYLSSFKEEESKRLNKKSWKASELFLATVYLKIVQPKSSY